MTKIEILKFVFLVVTPIFSTFATIVWFFVKRSYNKTDKKFNTMFEKMDNLQSSMHDYIMALEIVKNEQNNTKEVIGELKSDVKHVWKRFDMQKNEIEKNKTQIIKLESAQENCPAKNSYEK